MTIKQLREFLNETPNWYDDNQICFREVSVDGEYMIAIDRPIVCASVNNEGKELLLFDLENDEKVQLYESTYGEKS